MPNFNVLLEGAWLVRDVKTEDDAIGVAISEAGKRLNQRKMDFVEVEVGQWDCPECNEPLDGVFLVASTALVALLFEIKIFNAESEEHAGRIAKSTVGKALGTIPLRVIEAEQEADQRTPVVRDQLHPVQPEFVQQRQQVPLHRGDVVPPIRGLRAARPAQIRRDHPR